MPQGRIYTYDSKTDGWKKFPDAPVKIVKVDGKMRGIKEWEIPLTHYCVAGKTLCGLPEAEGSSWYNDTKNQCDGCREGMRQKTKHDFGLRDSGDETENVVDYKANAAKDKPEAPPAK